MDMRETDSTILVTGATGFVGPYLLEALRSHPKFADATVYVWKYRSGETCGADPYHVDICDSVAVEASIQSLKPTHIIHLAAQSHVPTSFENPRLTWDINVMGTLNLFEAVKTHVPHALLLYISSSEVYGRSFQKGIPLQESTLLQPQNPYASSKAAADIMAGQYAAQGLQVVRLRPFNHIGPGQSEQFVASAFASQIARIEAGLQPPVIEVGNLDSRRDFLDVRDVVRAYTLALESFAKLTPGMAVNLCSGKSVRIGDLLNQLLELSACDIKIKYASERMRASDIPVALGNYAAAGEYLGWCPQISINDSLRQLLDYWRQCISTTEMGE
jgi:GDP-4-dehydro-6-deoxy-D-mannose reductase